MNGLEQSLINLNSNNLDWRMRENASEARLAGEHTGPLSSDWFLGLSTNQRRTWLIMIIIIMQ